jgi:hypothetical protein
MMATRLLSVILLAVVGITALPTVGWAQLSTYRIDVRKAEVVDNEYTIFFSLLGSNQQAIKRVDPKAIKVLDADNQESVLNTGETEIKLLADRTDRHVAIMFLVANTRAFNNKSTNSRIAVKEFVERVRSNGDLVGMVTYGRTYSNIPFSPDIAAIGTQIEGIPDGDEAEPRFFNALGRATNRFAQDLDQQQIDLKYLVIISNGAGAWTGRTNRSFGDQKVAKFSAKLKELGIIPIIIGFEPLEADDRGIQMLRQLASQAKGTFREAKDSEDVLDMSTAAYDEIYGSHVMTFHSSGLTHGEQHKIRLSATVDAQKLKSPPYQLYVPEHKTAWVLWIVIIGGILLLLGLLAAMVVGIVILVRRRKTVDEEEMYYEPEPMMMAPVAGQVAPAMVKEEHDDTPPAQYYARLRAKTGPLHGRNFYLTEKVVTMGSAESNQIQLDDGTISKKHAGIRIKNERVEVHDFGSTNGVFINGRRVSQQYLKNGDIIKMGDTELEFTLK